MSATKISDFKFDELRYSAWVEAQKNRPSAIDNHRWRAEGENAWDWLAQNTEQLDTHIEDELILDSMRKNGAVNDD
jgi:hypothetical protein